MCDAEMRSKQASNTLEEAHIKALRLYRRFCRLVPFIIRNNWLQYKTTPALAKQQLALQFRIYARTTDIEEIDTAIAEGYEQMLNMEQVYVEPAGCFIELAPKERHRDTGYSFFDQRFAKNNKKASGFLTDFYKLTKDPDS